MGDETIKCNRCSLKQMMAPSVKAVCGYASGYDDTITRLKAIRSLSGDYNNKKFRKAFDAVFEARNAAHKASTLLYAVAEAED